ncbi:MAG: NarL family signal transduction histidine kinase [Parcubacteria group bacterium Gr01-1014_48]|nr:MAG: NarL family signal transduction histidine kinase [Parcubacteria group bacterium Gr01-1014_48]TSD01557.1 MAG: NarL family signal transduction histidine kinase [Parcubacteria group bacterium Greene1014_15]TSD08143.1 MAG: NarL family signal transduction histidine kinase [Parcubacteria group bacterium Greene0714_4]
MNVRKPLPENKLIVRVRKIKPLARGFAKLGDHVVITDENACILYANKAMERTTGFSVDEVMGKNPGDLWGGKMPNEFYTRMWNTIKVEKKPFVGEVRNVRKNGEEYWQELHISPILDARGEVKFLIGIEPNITDRKEKERFKDEFISIVGHQLKSPLAAIRWILDLLQKDRGLTVRQRQSLEDIYASNLNLLDLVNDLLLVSRTGNVGTNRKTIDLAQVIRKIIAQIERQHPTISFSFSNEGTNPLYANEVLVLQIFTNIIANAAEYSDENSGKVEVKLLKEKEHGFYIFTCKDNGIGIPPQDQEKIFSKAFRASNTHQAKKSGTGLGLFIVKTIADSLGWTVSFESTIGNGTTFFLKIPTDG